MSRDQLLALSGGTLSAALSLSAATGLAGAQILASLAQLPLFLVGLGLGTGPAATACVTAAVIIAVAASVATAGYFTLSTMAPVLLITFLALRSQTGPDGKTEWYPAGDLLSALAALGVGALVTAALYFSGQEGGLIGVIHRFVLPLIQNARMPMTPEQIDAAARGIARFAPAAMIMGWMAVVAVNAGLAQGVLIRLGRNIRPAATLRELDPPLWMHGLLIAAALGSLLPNQFGMIALNGVLILLIPFFLFGMAVIHTVSRRWQGRGFILALIYVLVFVLQWPAIFVAGLGFAERWARLRRRQAGPWDQEEE